MGLLRVIRLPSRVSRTLYIGVGLCALPLMITIISRAPFGSVAPSMGSRALLNSLSKSGASTGTIDRTSTNRFQPSTDKYVVINSEDEGHASVKQSDSNIPAGQDLSMSANTTDLSSQAGLDNSCRSPSLEEFHTALPHQVWSSEQHRCEPGEKGANQQLDQYRISNYHILPRPNYLANYRAACFNSGGRLVCMPSVFVAGFEKSGTTDLVANLVKHPMVEGGNGKEQHFWAQSPAQGLRKYAGMFSRGTAQLSQWCSNHGGREIHSRHLVDGSPTTIWKHEVWGSQPANRGLKDPKLLMYPAIRNILPDAYIISTVRNPPDRIYSEFFHRFPRDQIPTKQFFHERILDCIALYSECLARNTMRQCAYNVTLYRQVNARNRLQPSIGFFHVFLEDWLKITPEKQFYVMRFEDYKKNRTKVLSHMFRFLDLEPPPFSVMRNIAHAKVDNARGSKKHHNIAPKVGDMLPQTRKLLEDFYRPFNRKLACLLGDERFTWGY